MFSDMTMTLEKNRAEFWGVEGAESRESETPQGFSVSWGKRKWSTIDANGNLLNDGTKSYVWDAENRLVQVNILNAQPATVADTIQMSYDGFGKRVSITESHGTTVLAAKTFVWNKADLCQERDSTGHTVTKQFFQYGKQVNGSNYFYSRDHLGSIREMTDSSGNIQSSYDYDSWGRQTVLSQTVTADFGYTGFYVNKTMDLDLTWFRAYDANMGRWLSRDPLGERTGPNLYVYVSNDTFKYLDPVGLIRAPYCAIYYGPWQEGPTLGDVKIFCDCIGLACCFVLPEIPVIADSGDLTLWVLGLSKAQKIKNTIGLAGAVKGAIGLQNDIKDNQTPPTPQQNPPSNCKSKK